MTAPTPETSQTQANPFNQLLFDYQNDPAKIQERYETHRTNRTDHFRQKLLAQDFPGWQVDEILSKLVVQSKDPNGDRAFFDHRHNLNLYARPPKHIKDLIATIREEIRDVAPTLWFSPPDSLHITTLEIASSRTQDEIDAIAAKLIEKGTAEKLVNYTADINHRACLIKPMISYDASAMALSFLPAAEEFTGTAKKESSDSCTYHHLRQGLADLVLESGTGLAARYVVPSAHVTIARFVTQDGFLLKSGEVDRDMVAALVSRIERINEKLRRKYWPGTGQDGEDDSISEGEWVIGQEQGLEFNKGASWYGGGEKVLIGKGFKP
ncbi:RNA ligase/cyclic nucleotide phosphodiesterase [Aspergillus unguis]